MCRIYRLSVESIDSVFYRNDENEKRRIFKLGPSCFVKPWGTPVHLHEESSTSHRTWNELSSLIKHMNIIKRCTQLHKYIYYKWIWKNWVLMLDIYFVFWCASTRCELVMEGLMFVVHDGFSESLPISAKIYIFLTNGISHHSIKIYLWCNCNCYINIHVCLQFI